MPAAFMLYSIVFFFNQSFPPYTGNPLLPVNRFKKSLFSKLESRLFPYISSTFFAVPEGFSRSCRSHIPKRWSPQARSRKAEKTSRQCHIGQLRRCFPFRWPPFRRISKRQKWEIICPWPNLLSFLNQFYHMAFSQSKRFGSKLTVYHGKPVGPLRCSEPAGYCSYSHSLPETVT